MLAGELQVQKEYKLISNIHNTASNQLTIVVVLKDVLKQ